MMTKQWSVSAQEQTRRSLEDLSYYPRDGKLFFKHINGSFGYIPDGDAIAGCYAMHTAEGEPLTTFDTVSDVLSHGWVLD